VEACRDERDEKLVSYAIPESAESRSIDAATTSFTVHSFTPRTMEGFTDLPSRDVDIFLGRSPGGVVGLLKRNPMKKEKGEGTRARIH